IRPRAATTPATARPRQVLPRGRPERRKPAALQRVSVMRWRGLEPPRPCGHKALNFAGDRVVCPIRSMIRFGSREFDGLEGLERLAATTVATTRRVGCYRVHPSVHRAGGPPGAVRAPQHADRAILGRTAPRLAGRADPPDGR